MEFVVNLIIIIIIIVIIIIDAILKPCDLNRNKQDLKKNPI